MRETRASRYANLRNEIENDKESGYSSEGLKPYAKRLNRFDDNVQVDEHTSAHSPSRVRHPETENNIAESTYKDDYLDSYIDEVKEYNKREGYTDFDDTKLDIFNNLTNKEKKPVNKVKRILADDVEEYQADYDKTAEIPFNMNATSDEISNEIARMLSGDDIPNSNDQQDIDEQPTQQVFIEDTINNFNNKDTSINSKINTSQFNTMMEEAYGSNRETLLNETQKIMVDFDNKHDLKQNNINDFSETMVFNKVTNEPTINKETESKEMSLTDQFYLRSDKDFENLRKSQESNNKQLKRKKVKKQQVDDDYETDNNKLNIVLNITIFVMIIIIAVIIYLVLKQRNII